MGKIAVWLIGLVLLSLIYALCVHFRVDSIEYDLKDRAMVSLLKNDLDWVRVAIDGRDIVIDGIAPDEDARAHAAQVVGAIWGVRAVENRTAVMQSETPPIRPRPTTDTPTSPTRPVVAAIDNHPTTVTESPATAESCQDNINQLLAERTIEFDTGSSLISEESYTLLNTLIDWLKTCPRASIEVGGHTDTVGEEQRNLSLSLQRAEAVARHLQRAGISGSRLSAVGYGSAAPIDSNDTEQGRKRNRRIELQINR